MRDETAGGALSAADILVLLFAASFPFACAWLYFDVLAATGWVPALYSVAKVVQFSVPILWVVVIRRRRPRIGPAPWRGLGVGVLLGLAIVAATAALYAGALRGSAVLAAMPERLAAKIGDFGLDSVGRYVAFAVFVSTLHAFLEEYYWRWYVFGELRRALPFVPAAALGSLAFMAHHVIIVGSYIEPRYFWIATVPFSLAVAAGGFVWAWLYERSGSLVGPWISHIFVDAGILAIGYDQVWGGGGS